MEKSIAIDTCLGVLRFRDCIFLDGVEQDDRGNLTFSCELETYENLIGTSDSESSDFDLIENSKWLESLPVRKDFQKSRYRHYRIFTYDIVYNIIASSYELKIDV